MDTSLSKMYQAIPMAPLGYTISCLNGVHNELSQWCVHNNYRGDFIIHYTVHVLCN